MDQIQIRLAYANRDSQIAALNDVSAITPEHIADLDRLGRFIVASDLWGKCTPSVQTMLFRDHPHVVSAAVISRADLTGQGRVPLK